MIFDTPIKPVMIFGCGNPLFGDDGFGPAVIDHLLASYSAPDHVLAVDAGTGVSGYLFDLLLSPRKPERVYILDAVQAAGRRPGELFTLKLEDIPKIKACDFSMHQFPSVNLLKEMRDDAGIAVRILVVQVDHIPDAVQAGLSPPVARAVVPACEWLIEQIGGLENICLTNDLQASAGMADDEPPVQPRLACATRA